MNKEQEAKFDQAFDHGDKFSQIMAAAHEGWRMCLEANGIGEEHRIPDGYFKPGEEVEIRDKGSDGDFMCAEIVVLNKDAIPVNHNRIEIRRIPAWKPKDWEHVIFAKPEDDTVLLGVYYKGEIHYGDLYYTADGIRYAELDVSKLGKPWSKIS